MLISSRTKLGHLPIWALFEADDIKHTSISEVWQVCRRFYEVIHISVDVTELICESISNVQLSVLDQMDPWIPINYLPVVLGM